MKYLIEGFKHWWNELNANKLNRGLWMDTTKLIRFCDNLFLAWG